MAASEQVKITFDGAIASQGKMLLYEYGRAQYAFSRVLTTVEQYRRTRQIIQKVSANRRVSLVVSAPEKGSFLLDVNVDTTPSTAAGSPDFNTLFALVLDRLIPPGEEFASVAQELARIKMREIDTGTHTGPPLASDLTPQVRATANGSGYSSRILVALCEWALQSSNRAIARADLDQDTLQRVRQISTSDLLRENTVRSYTGHVNGEEIDQLAARVRPMFREMAVPLGKSATRVSIGNDRERDGFYIFDKDRIAFIDTRVLDEEEIEIVAKIKNFDIETGLGSIRSQEFVGIRRFALDPAFRSVTEKQVGPAMNKSEITLICATYTDSNGVLSSYLIREVED